MEKSMTDPRRLFLSGGFSSMAYKIGLFLFLFLAVCRFFPAAEAAEVIHDYRSRIVVDSSGSLLVTEMIEVTAEGNDIKRGIYRDFPLYRRTFLGGILPSEYRILSVARGGKAEPYHTETSENNLRLYIGNSDVYLPTGQRYAYEIVYSIPRQVFFYKDHDELNWNVIGTGWSFPIERARAEIVLPDAAPILRYNAYVGKALSKDSAVQARQDRGWLFVEAQRALEPHEGMTVSVAFPKGHVTPSADMIGMAFFWRQHSGLSVMLIGLLLMAAYYGLAWNRAGRDPKGRGLAPFYDPPEGISPAMAAYISTMGRCGRDKTLTAAILALAAKGYLTVQEKGKDHYELVRTKQTPDRGPALSEDERIIYGHITTSLTIKPSSEALVGAANEHHKTLDAICRKRYFRENGRWWLGGVVPLAISLAVVSLNPAIEAMLLWMGLLFLLIFGGVSLGVGMGAVRRIVKGPLSQKVNSVFLVIWACLFSMGGFMGFAMMATVMSWLVIVTILVMAGLFAVMRTIMMAPTREGRAVMDHIDGLKYYMEAVEEKILKKFDPPQMSRELYEKYLPYAAALGVESRWADKFALAAAGAATAAAAATAMTHSSPSWYVGSGGSSSGFSAASMIGSFGSAISAASTSNSSGSGGGSIGGGGGGGGGGGW